MYFVLIKQKPIKLIMYKIHIEREESLCRNAISISLIRMSWGVNDVFGVSLSLCFDDGRVLINDELRFVFNADDIEFERMSWLL
jgi:hypothetical protein